MSKGKIDLPAEWFSIAKKLELRVSSQDQYRVFTDVVFRDIPERYRKEGMFNKIAVALKPFFVQDKYRIVLGYKDIAIDEDANVVKVIYNQDGFISHLEEVHQGVGTVGYPRVNIIDPDKHPTMSVKVYTHRLMGLAWLDTTNVDFTKQTEINHIDGIKTNNKATNLEWVTPGENQRHAVLNNLRSDNTPVEVLDCFTKQKYFFNSITDAANQLDVSMAVIGREFGNRDIIKIKHRYIMKHSGDDTVLDCGNSQLGRPESNYDITVTFPDGTVEKFYEQGKLKARFNYTGGYNITDLKTKIIKDNPGVTIEILGEGIGRQKPVKVYNSATGEHIYADSIVDMARKLGLDRRTVRALVTNRNKYLYNGYSFAYVHDPVDLSLSKDKAREGEVIVCRNINTRTTQKYPSLVKAAGALNLDRMTIKKYLDTGTPYNNYLLTTL